VTPMLRRTYPPDYVSAETLAYRLDIAVGAVEQYVKRGLLPAPRMIGEAKRWCWQEVDRRIRGVDGDAAATANEDDNDPYIRALDGATPEPEHCPARARAPGHVEGT